MSVHVLAAVGTTSGPKWITEPTTLSLSRSRLASAVSRPGDGGRGPGHQPGDLLCHPDGSVLQRPSHGWKPPGRDGHRGSGCHQPGAHLQGSFGWILVYLGSPVPLWTLSLYQCNDLQMHTPRARVLHVGPNTFQFFHFIVSDVENFFFSTLHNASLYIS